MTAVVVNNPKVEYVEQALYSLNFCAVDAASHLHEWFAPAFNEWFVPLVTRGYPGSFAAVFDFGLQVVAPGIGVAGLPQGAPNMVDGRFQRYRRFLGSLENYPLMERARSIWAAARESKRPGARTEVGWLLIDALIHDLFSGCPSRARFEDVNGGQQWDSAEVEHLQECPRCAKTESDRQSDKSGWLQQSDETPPGFVPPFVELANQGPVVVRTDEVVHGELELTVPPFDVSRPYPAFSLPEDPERADVPNRVRLFMARLACDTKHVQEVLDGAVVEACTNGFNKKVDEHRPPPRANPVLERQTKSKLPGRIGGVTRYETKTDLDSLWDVVPSELALLLADEIAGMQKLLEKPLIIKHELEQDRVPKHRALVCFLVESDEEHPTGTQAPQSKVSDAAYVYAKRQAFDVIRDLREAVQKLRNRVHVEIDVAVFVLSAYHADAVVHRLFRLDQLTPRLSPDDRLDQLTPPLSPDDRLDRFDQMISFSGLVPGFFNIGGARETAAEDIGNFGAFEIIDPQVERFLQRHPQRVAPYHANYIVAIGSGQRLMEFVPAAIQDARRAANIRNRVMLIAVHPERKDSSPGLQNEPAWSCTMTRMMNEAAQMLADDLPETPLGELRAEFLAMVLGAPQDNRRSRRLLQYRTIQGAEENHDA